jgi:hypothetical protein
LETKLLTLSVFKSSLYEGTSQRQKSLLKKHVQIGLLIIPPCSLLCKNIFNNFYIQNQNYSYLLSNIAIITGLVYGKGKFWKNWQKPAERSIDVVPEPKTEGGIEPILSAVKQSNYFIHWEKILVKDGYPSPNVFLSSTFLMRENDYFIKIKPMEWDACIYLNEVDPATPHLQNNLMG